MTNSKKKKKKKKELKESNAVQIGKERGVLPLCLSAVLHTNTAVNKLLKITLSIYIHTHTLGRQRIAAVDKKATHKYLFLK